MSVEVQIAVQRVGEPDAAQIIRWVHAVIDHMGDDEQRIGVCVRIVAEQESMRLNTNYRDQQVPTNVLSFPARVELPDSQETILGDIVICDPVVRREADAQNKAISSHYAHMVVHGMLHLYGYDHVDPREADAMEGIEREILERVGIGDPYRVS